MGLIERREEEMSELEESDGGLEVELYYVAEKDFNIEGWGWDEEVVSGYRVNFVKGPDILFSVGGSVGPSNVRNYGKEQWDGDRVGGS